MRYHILQRLDAEDNLALLFNAYMKPLFLYEQTVLPRESMREFRNLLNSAAGLSPTEEAAQRLQWAPPRLYQLCVLDNSLTDLYKHIHWALGALTKFFAEYEGDLKRYAIDTRLKVLDEFGSDDETDWEETGTLDEEGEPEWKVTYKDDEQSLERYSLHNDLAQHFAAEGTMGERIGTSKAGDFAYFSDVVARATSFNPLKMLRDFTGKELPLYHPNDEGQMIPESLGEEVERELNEDLRNESVVKYFRLVLEEAQKTAAHFHAATTTEDFRRLLTQLEQLRDVCFF
ncbi:hypothetical protein [Hymenobacter defluvii]|uniref:Uncharacterized protein n=1 Tax=Hymenobacter defluvii TaxID=2054411 RepID=A0ABS3TJ55_9BACT|nr:hypothetical protein [Hymenobacter defluvii]MBO3273208.1 hypothetical protein [Hymenobacter defluvii]